MHDINNFVQNTAAVKKNLSLRKFDTSPVDEVVRLNEERKTLTTQDNTLRGEVKNLSNQIGQIKKSGGNADELMAQVAAAKAQIEATAQSLAQVEGEIKNLLERIPNLVHESTPVGASEEENQEISRFGTPRQFSFTPKDHVDLGEKLGMLDFDAATKVTGARFVFYKSALARLERSLISYMLDSHTQEGYTEFIPPIIVHERSLHGTGQLPKFKEDLFKLENTDWYLIPTAEVPLTNYRREELFDKKELPLLMTAYTPCFRSEAGSYGRDTRGMIRQHQFNKVELVNIVAANDSERAHEAMIKRAQSILEGLELPYRSMVLCTGDIGFGAMKTIDLEVWLPSQNKYREISSISNCGDFQARRAGIRYRNDEGRPEFAHTLNGSGLAVGRTVVAIMENYQQEDGSIVIPKVLLPYMGGLTKIS